MKNDTKTGIAFVFKQIENRFQLDHRTDNRQQTERRSILKGLKTYILHLGDGNLDSNYMVRDDTCASTEFPEEKHRWDRHPYVAVLIDHPECGWILYDTGPSRTPKEDWTDSMLYRCIPELPEETSMENQLKLAGVAPKDIKHVVMSHLHMDHFGNAKLFADTADFYVAKREMEEAALMILQKPDPEWAAQFWYLRSEVFQTVKSWTYIDHEYELFPGIDVILLPGHTACVLGLLIHNENQPVLVVGDAINNIRNYNGMPPGPQFDSVGWRASVQKVHELQRKYNAQLVFGHDANQFYNELKLAPAYYD